jgi:hypothetical protein
MKMNIDRSEVNRALAKAIAYKACGKQDKAQAWAVRLVRLLQVANILDTQAERNALAVLEAEGEN